MDEVVNKEDSDGEMKPKHEARKHRESYLEDFEALLKENSEDVSPDCDNTEICDIDADFDALLEEENVVIQSPIPVKTEHQDNNTKSASDQSDISKSDGDLEPCINNNDDSMTGGNNNSIEETDNDVYTNTLSAVPASDSNQTTDSMAEQKVGV